MGLKSGSFCPFVTASIVLTGAAIGVGIAFFSPWWLQNVGLHPELDNNTPYIVVNGTSGNSVTQKYPHRGLWAQCGAECIWFWSSNYTLQLREFTPLKWHVASQVLYAIAGVCILVCEIYARIQMCFTPRSRIYLSLGIIVLISALFQTATVATFGGGAHATYNVTSDPKEIVAQLADIGLSFYYGDDFTKLYIFIGWSFWMAVVSIFLTIISGVFFLIQYCGMSCTCCGCGGGCGGCCGICGSSCDDKCCQCVGDD